MRLLLTTLLVAACAQEPASAPPAHASASAPSFLHEALKVVPSSFEGTVTEVVPAGGYTYLHLQTGPDATAWVVTLQRPAQPGDVVSVRPFGQLEQFTSARTGRRFDHLHFAIVTPRRS